MDNTKHEVITDILTTETQRENLLFYPTPNHKLFSHKAHKEHKEKDWRLKPHPQPNYLTTDDTEIFVLFKRNGKRETLTHADKRRVI